MPFQFLTDEQLLARLDSAEESIGKSLFRSDWSIDKVKIDGDHLTARGWYSADAGITLDILINRVRADVERYQRRDLTSIFAFLLPERHVIAFKATATVPRANEYKFELSRAPATIAAHYYPVDQASKYPIPPMDRVERVNGVKDVSTFKRSGYTHYKVISELLKKFSQKNNIRVLDWGCGCGTIGRYFLSSPEFSYKGCDIDHDNLDWCRQNLDDNSFFHVPLSPPGEPLILAHPFDCIFGVSVISHLNHHNIVEWSKWLALNLAPGGILLLTTLGLQAVSRAPAEVIRRLIDSGILFSEDRQHPISEIIGDRGFYGTSYQTPAFLSEAFREDFEMIDYKQGGVGLQDIVIFRRRTVP